MNAVFVTVLDEMHVHVIKALAPLGLHIMCEKPLATSLDDCIDILGTMRSEWKVLGRKTVFGVGHVLRYSPHNVLLRKLVREDRLVVQPFIHEVSSCCPRILYLCADRHRGNWRRQDITAATEKICERRGRIYGTTGEITYDSKTLSVHSFASGDTVKYPTKLAGKGHGGGDESMVENFCRPVQAVVSREMEASASQRLWLGCEIEEIVRSHVAVFAVEKARKERVVIDWQKFWREEVEVKLQKELRL